MFTPLLSSFSPTQTSLPWPRGTPVLKCPFILVCPAEMSMEAPVVLLSLGRPPCLMLGQCSHCASSSSPPQVSAFSACPLPAHLDSPLDQAPQKLKLHLVPWIQLAPVKCPYKYLMKNKWTAKLIVRIRVYCKSVFCMIKEKWLI